MLKGKGVSEGIGLGKAVLLRKEEINPKKIIVEDIEEEIKNFYDAVRKVENDTKSLIEKLTGPKKDIMQAYLLILQDTNLLQEPVRIIEQERCNADYAVEMGFNNIIRIFEEMEDPYMSQRSLDIADMKKKILSKMLQKEEVNLSKLPKNSIIVTEELTTSDTSKLDLKNIAGIITEVGGTNSHTAIIARTYAIPLIVGIPQIDKLIKEEDLVAMNGSNGEIFVNPSEEEIIEFKKIRENLKQQKEILENYKNQKSVTKDGHSVELFANIGGEQEAQIALKDTAEGIGLLRSEFIYMNSKDFPTEQEQFEAYKKVTNHIQNKKIIIRTLDIGGDKNLKYMQLPKEANPFLGYRAIRIFLDDIKLFKTQLRAILRASAYGNLAIMLPMISSIQELRKAKEIIQEVKEELREKNIDFKEDIEVGIMIEVPSAAIIAEELAKECDFFSIGTNDLIQYTIAVERGNEKVAKLYTHFHPAIIRLIKTAIEGAHKNNILCGMCGEAAGDGLFIPILIGLGLDEFSMNPNKILETRKLIRKLNFTDCKKLADKALKLSSSEEIINLIMEEK